MDNCLVLTSNRIDVLLARIKLSSNNMLRMPNKDLGSRPHPAWIPEQVNFPVVSSSKY